MEEFSDDMTMSDTHIENQLRLANNKRNERSALLEEKLLEKERIGETLKQK